MTLLERTPAPVTAPAAWPAAWPVRPPAGGADWRTWVAVDAAPAMPSFERTEDTLTIRLADDPASFGKWVSPPQPVVGGRTYRCLVWRATRGAVWPDHHATAVLNWRGSQTPPWRLGWKTALTDRGRDPLLGAPVPLERRVLHRPLPSTAAGQEAQTQSLPALPSGPAWERLEIALRAPDLAEVAELELWLRHAPGAQVWWAGAELTEAEDRAPRLVTLGTVRATPPPGGTPDDNRALLARLADEAAGAGADVICLPETATYYGTGLPNTAAAEPLDGPTTAVLGRVAAARRVWIVAQLPERRGHHVYNTAVLIDREGRLAAHYHKMHLTLGEFEAGLLPGDAPVVARTDFGTVGLLVCYDMHFPESTRLAALAGAEVLFAPTAGDQWTERREGGNRAHALANGVFVVTSLVQGPSDIIDPDGRILATATAPNSVATARVNLDYKETPEGRARGVSSALHTGGAYWLTRRADLYDRLTEPAVR